MSEKTDTGKRPVLNNASSSPKWYKTVFESKRSKIAIAMLPILLFLLGYIINQSVTYFRTTNVTDSNWPGYSLIPVNTTPINVEEYVYVLTTEEVISDRNELIRTVEEVHPLFLYEATDIYNQAKEAFLEATNQSMTRDEFWMQCAYYIASLEDEHSFISRGRHLNLDTTFEWRNDSLFLLNNDICASEKIVLSIAGIPVHELLRIVDRISPAGNGGINESAVQYYRSIYMNRQYVHTAAGAAPADIVTVVYQEEGHEGKIDVPYIHSTPAYPPVESTSFALLENDEIALVTTISFIPDTSFERTLVSLKAAIASGTRKLILDLRGASSGSSGGYMARLYKVIQIDPGHYGFTWNFSPMVKSKISTYWGRSGSHTVEPQIKQINNNNLDIVVLTDGHTASSGMLSATLIHDSGLGTIIGVEPRSLASQFIGATISRLPNASFPYSVSHIIATRLNPELDKGNKNIVDIPVAVNESALYTAISFLNNK